MKQNSSPKKGITIFLIVTTMLLSLALFACGVYSLYISIGFKFLNSSAGINTNPLFTYSNSVYGTGAGTMVGLILISILMLGLGVGMTVIFFKQLPLYKQIKLLAKMPAIKYKDYSRQARKSVVTYSIIAYVVCIAFAVFAIIVAIRSGIASNYLWIIVVSYGVVLALSIASMVLMIVKVVQLSKIRRTLIEREIDFNNESEQPPEQPQEIKPQEENKPQEGQVEVVSLSPQSEEPQAVPSEEQPKGEESKNTVIINQVQPKVETKQEKLFSDGIFELAEQLQKLREMHISGLISETEYTALREKWLNAVLSVPLFGKRTPKHKNHIEGSAEQSVLKKSI